jgi:CubicO group peptidase (beta-lactamase class C family)
VLLAYAGLLGVPALATETDASLERRASELVSPAIESGTANAVAVGLLTIDAQGMPRRIAFTVRAPDNGADVKPRITPKTLFEIGSITKTFTGLLLADLALRGVVSLDDPAQKFLPAGVTMPRHGERPIRLIDLSNHNSGLPRLPNNMQPADPLNPYADYDADLLYKFLNSYKLRYAPEERSAYSNLGAGLLGHLLERAAGQPYEALIKERICTPLGMNNTLVTLDGEHQSALAPGHDADGAPAKPWDLNVLVGAGGLRSNVDDMLVYLEAQFCLRDSPLNEAIRLSHQPRQEIQQGQTAVALGWHLFDGGQEIAHDGGTGGYRSFAGFRPHDRAAVVLLCDTSANEIPALGRALLKLAAHQEFTPPTFRHAIELAGEQLDQYVGDYNLDGVTMSITRDGHRLLAQLGIQPRFRIWPSSETEFFYRVVDARITFERDDHGKTTALVLHQNGRDLKAPRASE